MQQQQQRQQQQQQQQQQGFSSSQELEGADRVMPSVEHHAEMQHGARPEQVNAADQGGQPVGRSAQRVRVYAVRWSKMRDALMWLKEHNPAYEHIDIQIPSGPDLQPDAGEFNNAPFQQMQHFMQNDDQPQLAEDALAAALGQAPAQVSQHMQAGAAAAEHNRRRRRPRFVLERIDGQPLSIHDEKNIEALSFLKIFPTCQNHYGTARDVKVTNSAYAKARLLSADQRCQDPHYMSYWLSTFQHLQLTDSVKVALRWSNGTPTVQQVRQQLQQQRQPDPDDDSVNATSGRKLWAFMEGIRGTAAYWSRSAKDLFAMYRSLGSATWFLTLSANDMHWDDLAIVLLNAKRRKEGLAPMTR